MISRLFLILIFAGVILSPRLGDSGLASFLRIDDILLPVTFLLVAFNFSQIRRPLTIIAPFLLFFLFNLVVAVLVHFGGLLDSDVRLYERFLPALKGLQYLIYFLLSYVIAINTRDMNKLKSMILCIVGIFSVDLLYGVVQIVGLEFRGYYGVGIINEISPTLTGAVFLFSAVYSNLGRVITQNNKFSSIKWGALFLMSLLFVVLSGSRGAFVATSIYVLVMWFSSPSRQKAFQLILVCIFSVLTSITLYIYVDESTRQLALRLTEIFQLMEEFNQGGSRGENWTNILSSFLGYAEGIPLILVTGLGSGGTYLIFGQVMNAADSQIISVVVSSGVLGLILYTSGMVTIYRGLARDIRSTWPEVMPIYLGLFWAFNAFSLTQEVFILSKTGALFWLTLGLLLGIAQNDRILSIRTPQLKTSNL